MKELCLDASVENLGILFSFVTDELFQYGCSKKDVRQIKICVEEIFINIASYAYQPDTGKAKVTIDLPGEVPERVHVVISFTDTGRPFNPLNESPPDLDASLEERQIGGLGIYIVREKMDEVSYEYREGKNILTMTKDLNIAG